MTDRQSAQTDAPPRGEPPEKRRVFIVDDHAVVRDGYAMAINEEDDLTVCGDASNATEALRRIEALKPDVALVDLSLGDDSGLDLIARILEKDPDQPILVISMYEESSHAFNVLKAGALGYVMKKEKMKRVIEGIRTVLTGELFVSDQVKAKALKQMVSPPKESAAPQGPPLTEREQEVFGLIGQGLPTREIAKALHISPRTVDTHKERIRKKLGLANAVQLHHRAFQSLQQPPSD